MIHTVAILAAVCWRLRHFISTVLPKNATHLRFKCQEYDQESSPCHSFSSYIAAIFSQIH